MSNFPKIRMKFSEKQKEIIKKRLRWLEAQDLICHQWVANEWRTAIDFWDRHPIPTKNEKIFAISNIKEIMKNYDLRPSDISELNK